MSQGAKMMLDGLIGRQKFLTYVEDNHIRLHWSQSSLDWKFLCQGTKEFNRKMLTNLGQYMVMNGNQTRKRYDNNNRER